MDLNNNKGVLLPQRSELFKKDNFGETTLCLDGFGYGGTTVSKLENTKSSLGVTTSKLNGPDDGCRLVLGLGPTPTTYSENDYYSVGFNKNIKSASGYQPEFLLEGNSILKLGLDSSFSGQSYLNLSHIPIVDEGSTSAKKSGGYMPSLLLAPRMDNFDPGSISHVHPIHPQLSSEPSVTTEYSEDTTAVTSSSNQRDQNPKKCKFMGCLKGARGASGLCIGHGGGQRCQKPGCNKGAESRTAFCKAHGGGKRCHHLGCTKSAEGKTDFCIAHGGGRRCSHPDGCARAARGKSGLCIRHGGGKRCRMEGCTRSAEGQAALCISHGGGRRCVHQSCTKGAQGSTMFCKAHGGGKRCIIAGCTKGAEGSTPLCKGHGGGKRCLYDGGGICPKSVHGGTNFCVAHGGGKRCSVAGCTKSARGRTDCCVKHGGGKRCQYENCGKSAQGSTNFCKAHGGGKRCVWGEGKCEKFARGKSGLCAAHSSMVQSQETKKAGMIEPGLFRGIVSASAGSTTIVSSSSGMSVISDCTDSSEKPAKRPHLLIPPQVLVPLSMKSSSSSKFLSDNNKQEENGGENRGGIGGMTKGLEFAIPEGRVHNGGLISLLGGSFKNIIDI